jgi:hypothetical protein
MIGIKPITVENTVFIFLSPVKLYSIMFLMTP